MNDRPYLETSAHALRNTFLANSQTSFASMAIEPFIVLITGLLQIATAYCLPTGDDAQHAKILRDESKFVYRRFRVRLAVRKYWQGPRIQVAAMIAAIEETLLNVRGQIVGGLLLEYKQYRFKGNVMGSKDATRLIILQVLGLASLLFGRVPKINLAIAFLVDIVMNKFDELWAIGMSTPKMKAKLESPAVVDSPEDTKLLEFGGQCAEANGWK